MPACVSIHFAGRSDTKAGQSSVADVRVERAQKVARIVGGILLAVVVIIELVLGAEDKPGNSFSHLVRAWGIVGLGAAFGWGTLCGHFFHPKDDLRSVFHPTLGENAVLIVALLPMLVLIGIDTLVAATTDGWVYPEWVPPVSLFAGTVWGSLVWPVTMIGEDAR